MTVPRFTEMWIIKTIILLALLLYASVRDIKTREVPDSISVLLLILGFVDTDIERLPSMLLGMALVFPTSIHFSVNKSVKSTRRSGHQNNIFCGVSARRAERTFRAHSRADTGCNSYADHQEDSEPSERSAIPADSVSINRNSRGIFHIKGEVN